jgi:hypothetical protein
MRQLAEMLFRQAGREYRFTTVADVEANVRSMIASGLGAGIMRRDQALDAQRAHEAVIWNGWSAEASLFWVSSSDTPAAAARAVATVRDCVLEAWGGGRD